ncbi:DUF3347 domain-containing protein [Sphingobacterium sp. MYb382]|uniref:DUF3347 domain-containing protein n=1 Tax=Sphingobacterium sp. MYb382 TaxID=2745278 RepID=UPI0030A45832
MKTLSKVIMLAALTLSAATGMAQIKNQVTETVKVYGSCGMCKENIETAGNEANVAQVSWDSKQQQATLTYDSKQTNKAEILKRIAAVGYDNEGFQASNAVYKELHACCQYDRPAADAPPAQATASEVHSDEATQATSAFATLLTSYLAVKDALVQSDANTAAAKAKDLLTATNAVSAGSLNTAEQAVWTKVYKNFSKDVERLVNAKDIAAQRKAFTNVSNNLYTLAKVSKTASPIYYQHCPMFNGGQGGNWLSLDSAVKNPYFGSQMLSCGKTVETLK